MSRVPGTVSSAAPAEHPEPTTLAEARGCCIDHGLDQLGECGSLGHVAGRIDDDVMTGHHLGQVWRLIHNATSHAQVWRTRELCLVSDHRCDFVSTRKRCSENALAGVAGGAEEKDFHNRTSSFEATRRSKAYIRLIPADVRCSPESGHRKLRSAHQLHSIHFSAI